MHFPCSSVHISSLSSLPVCGKRMILWLRMKELNLVLSTQQNIWAAKSLSKPERAFSKLTFAWSSRLENEFFQLWAANANINTHITGCKEAALQYVFQTRLSFFVHSFCFWNLLFFTFLLKVIIDLHCGETPAHEHWKKLRLNLGTAEPAIVYPNLHFPYGGTWTPTYSAVPAFCRSFWTFISTKENVLCLTETSCLNRNVSPVFFLAWPLILVSCTREIQSLQSQFY